MTRELPTLASFDPDPKTLPTTLTGRLQASLSRVTTSGKFIPEIDGLRFMAIAPVIIVHVSNYLRVNPVAAYTTPVAQDWTGRLTRKGHYGVQLFFIISGFVLALPFASHYLKGKPVVNLKNYFLRRLTRLEPPYILVMLACFILLVVVRGDRTDDLLPHLAAGLAYLHGAIYGTTNPVNLITWSLEVEIQFYLLVPLLTGVFAIRTPFWRRSLIGGAGLLIASCQIMFVSPEDLSLGIINYLQYFLAGFLLADLYLHELKQWASQRRLWWDFVTVVGWPLLILVCGSANLARLLFAPLALLLCCAAFGGKWTNRAISNRWLTVIGGMCYTIYLIHFQLLSGFERLVGKLALTKSFTVNLLFHLALFAPFLLVCSAIYFVLIEKPCMRRNWPANFGLKVRNLFASQTSTSEKI